MTGCCSFPWAAASPRDGWADVSGAVSVLLTWLVIGVLVYLLASVLLPELYKSVINLMGNVETYYNTINGWVRQLLDSNPELETLVSDRLKGYYTDITTWLDTLLPQATALMSAVSGGVVSALNFLLDLLVGVIVSIFLLATKEQCAAYARKVIFGLFSESSVPWVLRGIHKVDSIFSGFVRGKLLDSLIIGILCFICCSLFQFPYTPLVSVIVGVTNVIPFFGPFLGAIPSIFLILLDSPIQAVYFALFVLALQQLDGNVIGPLILGDQDRPFQPVGHCGHSGGRQLFRRAGDVLRRAGVCLLLQRGQFLPRCAAAAQGPAAGYRILYHRLSKNQHQSAAAGEKFVNPLAIKRYIV